ncbi:DUF1992 domain-containing protein [Candidatus Villigracilis saccharophilus]|uniref:DnaJ family domain-containing protein n=1 Tax=Candidatus Villigracilis saccharophilus TaxID=3140684 RepID=UPI0031360F37|nr:DUF1992 domain-containing protein [Anaerolineales bacterium]
MFDKTIDAIIEEAMKRGKFDDLPGKGKPIDLTAYFETPEDLRAAHSMLKNAGFTPREVDLLKEIAELKKILAAVLDEKKKEELQKQINQKQIEFSLMMERQKRQRKGK